jgi:endonuclease/exonuclease/phosphatase (EEP) superfamily protein YafD
MIGAETTVAGRDLRLFNTHLLAFFMLGSSSTLNPYQRNLVADQLAAAPGPTIIAGDFNVSRHQTLVDQFAGLGYATVQQSAVTWRRRPYVLDHIFHNAGLRCVAHQVVPSPASDHHVIVADFEFVG